MKKSLILIAAILVACLQLSAQKETKQEIKPDINSVVVYLDGVEYSHVVPVKFSAGRNLLIFSGLSSKLDPKSIRVRTSTEVSVLAISSKIDYLIRNEEQPRIKSLRDSLILVSAKLQSFTDESNSLIVEREMLLKNQSIGGIQNGVNVTELQKAADFYQSRIFEINKRLSQISTLSADFAPVLINLSNELNELNVKASYTRSEISVLLSADVSIDADFDLRYYVSDAGWAPYYELKSEDIGQPIELIYRARVYNNTDIDWTNVKLILSTGDPTKSVAQPKLNPWKLNYEYEVSADYNETYQYNWESQSNLNDNYDFKQKDQQNNLKQKGEVFYTTIEVSQLSVEFDIENKYSIPSNSKPYIVDVTQFNLPATYKHICIPKEDKDVFLLARITGWEDLNLVEGPASVYFGGSYVGQSYIFTKDVSDTLDLSLGRDNKVMISRTKMKEYTDKQFIGTKRKETYRYQIVVKNNRKAPINIEIQDQVPVSENDEIEVVVDETSKADYNLLSGICKWNFTLESDKSNTMSIQYTVKYPKNKTVHTKNEKFRSINCPSF